MRKIYTILVTDYGVDSVKKVLKKYHIEKEDRDASKYFYVQGQRLKYYIIVTTDDIFDKIMKEINGTRIY